MKAIILTEGGKNIGFGHITRCISLYQAFEEKGIRAEIIINGDNAVLDFLKNKAYQIFDWIGEEGKLFRVISNADIVVTDSYLAKKSLYDKISEILKARLLMIDDFNRIEYPKGIVVNPSIYGDKLNYPEKDGQVYLLGKDYIILRKEFWGILEKKNNKEVKNILITLGGAVHLDMIYKVVNVLKAKFAFNFYIVENTKRIDAEEMLNLMLKADICISGGGQTTYELARVGLPTIGICLAENQRLNLEEWQRIGFVEYIGCHNDGNLLEKIGSAIKQLMPFEKRSRCSKIGKNWVDGKGIERIMKVLLI